MCIGPEILLALQVAGVAGGVAGAAVQYKGAQDQSEASQRGEAARKQQMEIESSRKQREIQRQAQVARSVSLARGTDQGAAFEGSSALPGAYGQITGNETQARAGVYQATDIGRSIFDANADYAEAQSLSAFGSGLSKLSGSVMTNAKDISVIGESILKGDRS